MRLRMTSVGQKQIPFPPQRANALAGDPGFGNDKQKDYGMTSKGLFRLGGVEAAVVVVQEVVLGGFEVQERAVTEAGGEGGSGRGVRTG